MVLFALAVNKGLCTTFRTVLVKMALVHKKPVNAQLFKGNHIVLALIEAQFFQLGFQSFPGLFHLLDGEILACMGFQLVDGGNRFINLLLNDTLLPLKGQRNALKLAMPDDDGIIVAGGDAGAELLAVFGFKVLFGGDQQVGRGIEAQELRGPLLGQVIGHGEEGLAAEAQPFGFMQAATISNVFPAPTSWASRQLPP